MNPNVVYRPREDTWGGQQMPGPAPTGLHEPERLTQPLAEWDCPFQVVELPAESSGADAGNDDFADSMLRHQNGHAHPVRVNARYSRSVFDILTAISQALGTGVDPRLEVSALYEQVRELLKDRSTLLLLEDSRTLSDEARSVVERLTRDTQIHTVLITRREQPDDQSPPSPHEPWRAWLGTHNHALALAGIALLTVVTAAWWALSGEPSDVRQAAPVAKPEATSRPAPTRQGQLPQREQVRTTPPPPVSISEPISEPVSEPRSESRPVPLPESVSEPEPWFGNLTGADWLLALNPGQYTLQLGAYRAQENVERLLDRLGRPESTRWFQRGRDADAVFIVVHGEYGAYAQATAALEDLPTDIAQLNPRVRSVRLLQESLRRELPEGGDI